ncbi:MAG: thioredoxin-dependent thiol peroxidase [Chloroflexi bacterium]|nr:thioredoxin-dependent thiol peroxidase [Chloroflexota bacterium]BCY18732.1 peroxiredoxin [Leptolinea sp. HRD-7]
MPLEQNVTAPDFTLEDESGNKHTLSQYKGHIVLLYFYPKDDTPGCTTEACNFRDDYSNYEKAGVTILGVSPDSVKAHKKFKDKYNLPFTLLADIDHKVCDLYGVWGRKKFMGKEYDGVFRTSFLIDKNGRIKKVYENVKPAEHSKDVIIDIGKSMEEE